MQNSFIKNDSLLEETFQVDDLFEYDEHIDSFDKVIDSVKESCIFGYLGSFGSGKSTLINNVLKKREGKNSCRI